MDYRNAYQQMRKSIILGEIDNSLEFYLKLLKAYGFSDTNQTKDAFFLAIENREQKAHFLDALQHFHKQLCLFVPGAELDRLLCDIELEEIKKEIKNIKGGLFK